MRTPKSALFEGKSENFTDYSLMLVAFPELEGTPFSDWLRSTLAWFFAPLRRGIEILLVDSSEVIRGIFLGH